MSTNNSFAGLNNIFIFLMDMNNFIQSFTDRHEYEIKVLKSHQIPHNKLFYR